MILPVLVLGGHRYLTLLGEVIDGESPPDERIALSRSFNSDYDPELAGAPGDAERVTPKSRKYWEDVARRGGHDLDDLLRTADSENRQRSDGR